MKKVKPDWVGYCDNCGCDDVTVLTESDTASRLNVGDIAKCDNCGLIGEFDTDGEGGWVDWFEVE